MMTNRPSDFYITLPSNTHPDSKTGDYCIRLPTTLNLDGRWEVALTEIMFPHAWNNVNSTSAPNDPYLNKQNDFMVLLKSHTFLMITVRPGYYANPYELLEALEHAYQHAMTQHWKNEKDTFTDDDKIAMYSSVRFWYDSLQKRVTVSIDFDHVQQLVFSRHLQYMLGLEDPLVEIQKTTAKYPIDIRGGLDALYIYSDILVPQIVGNTYAPLLRICHITGKHSEIVHKVFNAPNYIPVIAHELSKIDISIRTDIGNVVPFLYGKVICKLHFKKKRLAL